MAEFAVSTERTLVSGAARIPACTNCCGSGVVHFRKESSSACTARGLAAKGRAKDCTAPRFTTARRAIFSPSLRSWAMATPCVSPKWGDRSISPQGSRRYEGEEKKISRTVYWTFAAQVRSHISQSLVELDDPINMRYAFSVTIV